MKKMLKNCGGSNSQALYSLGMIGAVIFYVQQSQGFVEVMFAVLKGIVWPAFLVFDLLSFIS